MTDAFPPGAYIAYSKEHTPKEMVAAFERRYGRKPQIAGDAGTIWLLGPMTPSEIKERMRRR